MRKLITILLFPVFCFGQNKDWQELQGKIDTAVKYNGVVVVDRNYTIDRPLIAAKWDIKAGNYAFFTIQIIGNAQMWDGGTNSVITATFKDAPALSIQRGKGCVIRGLYIQGGYVSPNISTEQFFQSDFQTYGDTLCRDSRYSPYAGICIDPFSSVLPPDGGYPSLKEWYRGIGSGGSTGTVIENCTVDKFTVAIIYSPNGSTANNELNRIENIRCYNSKAFFAGCQAQEKSNLLRNINCWGRTHTMLVFGWYGAGTAGFYSVDGMQIAGGVVRLIDRNSGAYYPITMTNVFTEGLGSIGKWQTLLTDELSNSVIHFAPPSMTGIFPTAHIYGGGVTLRNVTMRYYGGYTLPIFLKDVNFITGKNFFDQPPVTGTRANEKKDNYTTELLGYSNTGKVPFRLLPGTNILIADTNSFPIHSIATIGPDSLTMMYACPNVKPGVKYALFRKINL